MARAQEDFGVLSRRTLFAALGLSAVAATACAEVKGKKKPKDGKKKKPAASRVSSKAKPAAAGGNAAK